MNAIIMLFYVRITHILSWDMTWRDGAEETRPNEGDRVDCNAETTRKHDYRDDGEVDEHEDDGIVRLNDYIRKEEKKCDFSI